MRVLAEGRASEILDLGCGRVLRRLKAGGRPAREAEIMEHARAHGYRCGARPRAGLLHRIGP